MNPVSVLPCVSSKVRLLTPHIYSPETTGILAAGEQVLATRPRSEHFRVRIGEDQ